jgi:hypothetical protein
LSADTYSPVLIFHVLHESPYRLAASATEAEMNELIRKDEQERQGTGKRTERPVAVLPTRPGQDRIIIKVKYHALIVEKIIESHRLDAGLVVMARMALRAYISGCLAQTPHTW